MLRGIAALRHIQLSRCKGLCCARGLSRGFATAAASRIGSGLPPLDDAIIALGYTLVNSFFVIFIGLTLILRFAQIRPLQFVQCARVFRLRGLPCLCVRHSVLYPSFSLFAPYLPPTAFYAFTLVFIWFGISCVVVALFGVVLRSVFSAIR